MLSKLINEIKRGNTPISLRSLSEKLEVDESTVAAMIEFLVEKGVVVDHSRMLSEGAGRCSARYCTGCPIKECPFAKMPKMYSLKKSRDG